jgi:hypothetical protein
LDSLKGRDHSKDLGIDERITLKRILKKQVGGFGQQLFGS